MSANASTSHGGGGPIFIVGAMGSGTTLMRLILDSHPDIAIAQETGFMRAVVANKWIPFWKFGGEWYGRLGWSEEELDAELAAFYGRLFQRFAEQQGKKRWGDKTPYHTWHIPEAAKIFDDAVFLAIVRHPGAVSASLHDRFSYHWERAVNHWVRCNLELIRRCDELGDRIAVCRYEDLVLDPEPLLHEVSDWLDVEWSPAMLEHHVVHSERGTPTKVEGHTRSDDPIDTARIGKWRSLMDDHGTAVLRRDASDLAAFFGYDVDRASAPEPWDAQAPRRRLLTGDDLTKRQAALGITDWGRPWPRPSMVNQQLRPRRFDVVAKKRRNKTSPASGPGHTDQQPSAIAKASAKRLPAPVRERIRSMVRWARRR